MSRKYLRKVRTLFVPLAMMGSLILAGCAAHNGSSNSNSAAASKGASVTSSSTSGQGKYSSLQSEIAKYEKQPVATAPGPAFDASKAAGDTIYTVPTASSVPIIKLQDDALTKALALEKVHVVNYRTDGSPLSWVKAIQAAIGHKASAIVLEGPNPQLVANALKKAKTAGIPVIWDFAVPGPVSAVAPNVTATVSLPFPLGGRLMAELAILQTKGHAVVELVGLNAQRQNAVYEQAIESTLQQYCSSCSVAGYLNAPIPNWSNVLTTQVSGLLRKNPKINVIIPYYDGTVEYIAPGVREAGATGRVHIITHDGTPAVIKKIADGKIVTADVGTSNRWQAWATADQVLRVITGHKPAANENITQRVWIKSNVKDATGPNDENGYGNSYIAMYKKLWGLK